MFVMADLQSGTTSIGSGWELTVIAGVVVGGVSLFGGAGTMAGGITGILLLQVVSSGLVVVGVSSNWQQIAVGVIMVLAVGLDIVRRRYFTVGAGASRGAKPANARQPAKSHLTSERPATTPAIERERNGNVEIH
jgi:ribose transport system permease protein